MRIKSTTVRVLSRGVAFRRTFHETVLAGIPVLVWPVFGDQESVAETAGKLGIGVPIETPISPNA